VGRDALEVLKQKGVNKTIVGLVLAGKGVIRDHQKVITKLPNTEQSYKGKVKTHNYINRQNQSTTGKL
jgi:glycine cleavage system aminomethyltransferase T